MIKGIDVSHWNGLVDWRKVVAAGFSFGFLKATEGRTYLDPMFTGRWIGARDAGVVRGAYHFFRGHADEARNFLNELHRVGGLEMGDLPPVLDWEAHSPGEIDAARAWLKTVERETGRVPIIYTSPAYADALRLKAEFARYPLWLAHYGVAKPRVPAPWSAYSFWQSSEHETVPGVSGTCDFNQWNGTLEELHAFAARLTEIT